MDALFVIPALVSPTVPDRLVPGLAKMIERNTILNYSSQLRIAAMRKYANWFKTATMEGENIEEALKVDTSKSSADGTPFVKVGTPSFTVDADPFSVGGAVDTDARTTAPHTIGDTQVEVPKGISFYNVVSLEPTFLEIPIEQKRDIIGITGKSARIIRIGMKCVPYKLDGVDNIMNMLKASKNINLTTSYVKRRVDSILKRNVLNPTKRKIYRGDETSGDTITDVLMGPTSEDLSDPKILSGLMHSQGSAKWASLIMFTTMDFEGSEMKDLMGMYRDIVKAGWGDMLIIDENREGVYFCTTKTMACSMMPYNYVRQILKMDNVIDYRETSSLTRPFSMVSVRSAMRGM